MSLRVFFSGVFLMGRVFYLPTEPGAEWGEPFIFSEIPAPGFEGAHTITVPNFFATSSSFENFLEVATGISSRDYPRHISFLKKLDPRTQMALKNIFIGDRKVLAFLRIAHHLKEEYGAPSVGCGCLNLRQDQTPICADDSDCGDSNCPMRAISLLCSCSET